MCEVSRPSREYAIFPAYCRSTSHHGMKHCYRVRAYWNALDSLLSRCVFSAHIRRFHTYMCSSLLPPSPFVRRTPLVVIWLQILRSFSLTIITAHPNMCLYGSADIFTTYSISIIHCSMMLAFESHNRRHGLISRPTRIYQSC